MAKNLIDTLGQSMEESGKKIKQAVIGLGKKIYYRQEPKPIKPVVVDPNKPTTGIIFNPNPAIPDLASSTLQEDRLKPETILGPDYKEPDISKDLPKSSYGTVSNWMKIAAQATGKSNLSNVEVIDWVQKDINRRSPTANTPEERQQIKADNFWLSDLKTVVKNAGRMDVSTPAKLILGIEKVRQTTNKIIGTLAAGVVKTFIEVGDLGGDLIGTVWYGAGSDKYIAALHDNKPDILQWREILRDMGQEGRDLAYMNAIKDAKFWFGYNEWVKYDQSKTENNPKGNLPKGFIGDIVLNNAKYFKQYDDALNKGQAYVPTSISDALSWGGDKFRASPGVKEWTIENKTINDQQSQMILGFLAYPLSGAAIRTLVKSPLATKALASVGIRMGTPTARIPFALNPSEKLLKDSLFNTIKKEANGVLATKNIALKNAEQALEKAMRTGVPEAIDDATNFLNTARDAVTVAAGKAKITPSEFLRSASTEHVQSIIKQAREAAGSFNASGKLATDLTQAKGLSLWWNNTKSKWGGVYQWQKINPEYLRYEIAVETAIKSFADDLLTITKKTVDTLYDNNKYGHQSGHFVGPLLVESGIATPEAILKAIATRSTKIGIKVTSEAAEQFKNQIVAIREMQTAYQIRLQKVIDESWVGIAAEKPIAQGFWARDLTPAVNQSRRSVLAPLERIKSGEIFDRSILGVSKYRVQDIRKTLNPIEIVNEYVNKSRGAVRNLTIAKEYPGAVDKSIEMMIKAMREDPGLAESLWASIVSRNPFPIATLGEAIANLKGFPLLKISGHRVIPGLGGKIVRAIYTPFNIAKNIQIRSQILIPPSGKIFNFFDEPTRAAIANGDIKMLWSQRKILGEYANGIKVPWGEGKEYVINFGTNFQMKNILNEAIMKGPVTETNIARRWIYYLKHGFPTEHGTAEFVGRMTNGVANKIGSEYYLKMLPDYLKIMSPELASWKAFIGGANTAARYLGLSPGGYFSASMSLVRPYSPYGISQTAAGVHMLLDKPTIAMGIAKAFQSQEETVKKNPYAKTGLGVFTRGDWKILGKANLPNIFELSRIPTKEARIQGFKEANAQGVLDASDASIARHAFSETMQDGIFGGYSPNMIISAALSFLRPDADKRSYIPFVQAFNATISEMVGRPFNIYDEVRSPIAQAAGTVIANTPYGKSQGLEAPEKGAGIASKLHENDLHLIIQRMKVADDWRTNGNNPKDEDDYLRELSALLLIETATRFIGFPFAFSHIPSETMGPLAREALFNPEGKEQPRFKHPQVDTEIAQYEINVGMRTWNLDRDTATVLYASTKNKTRQQQTEGYDSDNQFSWQDFYLTVPGIPKLENISVEKRIRIINDLFEKRTLYRAGFLKERPPEMQYLNFINGITEEQGALNDWYARSIGMPSNEQITILQKSSPKYRKSVQEAQEGYSKPDNQVSIWRETLNRNSKIETSKSDIDRVRAGLYPEIAPQLQPLSTTQPIPTQETIPSSVPIVSPAKQLSPQVKPWTYEEIMEGAKR